MLRRTARGEVTRSRFLSPAEAHALSAYLLRGGHTKDCFFYGGYPEAERTRLFLLPGYLTDFLGRIPRETSLLRSRRKTSIPQRVTPSG